MRYISLCSAIVGTLCFTSACSDSAVPTAPVVPSAVSADIVAVPCQAELDALRGAINGAMFTGKGADEANLIVKVDVAQAKLAEGKTADAILKLEDIRATVTALSTPDAKGKTKLDATGAASIIAAVDRAEECIEPAASAAA